MLLLAIEFRLLNIYTTNNYRWRIIAIVLGSQKKNCVFQAFGVDCNEMGLEIEKQSSLTKIRIRVQESTETYGIQKISLISSNERYFLSHSTATCEFLLFTSVFVVTITERLASE